MTECGNSNNPKHEPVTTRKMEDLLAQADAMRNPDPRASSLEAMLARISAETCRVAQAKLDKG